MGFSAKDKANAIDEVSRWWKSYPTGGERGKWISTTRPREVLRSYLADVYEPAKRLVRSASATRLTYSRDADVSTTPLRRTNSYSSLSPSHVLHSSERLVERIIPAYTSYQPKTSAYYQAVNNYRPLRSYSSPIPLKVTYDRITERQRQPSWKEESPRQRFYAPTSWPRWTYPHSWYEGRLKGIERMSPWLYKNYDRVEERPYMAYMTVRSQPGPWQLRKWQGSWHTYTPYRLQVVNYHYNYRI